MKIPLFFKALARKFVEHIHEIAIAFLVDIEKASLGHVLLVSGAVLLFLGASLVLAEKGGGEVAAAVSGL